MFALRARPWARRTGGRVRRLRDVKVASRRAGSRTQGTPCSSEGSERRCEVGAGLFGAPDPADDALTIEDEGHGHLPNAKAGRKDPVLVHDDRESEAVRIDLTLGVGSPFVLRDPEERGVEAVLSVELLELREGPLTGFTPLSEELHDDDLPTKRTCVEFVTVERAPREGRRIFADERVRGAGRERRSATSHGHDDDEDGAREDVRDSGPDHEADDTILFLRVDVATARSGRPAGMAVRPPQSELPAPARSGPKLERPVAVPRRS